MIVPSLAGIAKAVAGATLTHNTTETTAASTPPLLNADYTTIPRRRRGWGNFDITRAFLKASGSPGRSVPATSTHVNDLAERQTCSSGLTYYSCANGFKGCCAGNPCNSNTSCSLEGPETSASSSATSSKTGTSTRTATSAGTKTGTGSGTASRSTTSTSISASGTNSAISSNTGTAVSTIPTSSPSATATPTVSAIPEPQSSGSNVGAIAGGAVGGVAALVLLLALLALLIRRHRKKVDARREGEKLKSSNMPSAAPDGRYYGTQEISGHHRSGSTANDAYTLQGGSPYGHPDPSFAKSADHFSELEGHSSKAPGMRAEGGPSMIPAAVLRPPQMLDATPVGDRPDSKPSVVVEHMSEMEDTSLRRPSPSPAAPPPQSPSTMDSPVLGRAVGPSTMSLADDTRRKQHALYWNNYAPDHTTGRSDEGLSPSLIPKAPPTARTTPALAQMSPDASGDFRDSSFVVSPLRHTKSERGSDPAGKESKWNEFV